MQTPDAVGLQVCRGSIAGQDDPIEHIEHAGNGANQEQTGCGTVGLDASGMDLLRYAVIPRAKKFLDLTRCMMPWTLLNLSGNRPKPGLMHLPDLHTDTKATFEYKHPIPIVAENGACSGASCVAIPLINYVTTFMVLEDAALCEHVVYNSQKSPEPDCNKNVQSWLQNIFPVVVTLCPNCTLRKVWTVCKMKKAFSSVLL